MKPRITFMVLLLSLLALAGCGGAKTEGTNNATATQQQPTGSSKLPGGKLDACGLLTKADAESLLGSPVKEPTTTRNELGGTVVSQCRYSNAAGDKQVGLLSRQAPTTAEARQVFDSARSASKDLSGADPQTVSSLGDDAYWTAGNLSQLNVLKNDFWLIITARQGKGDRLSASKEAASKILSHMQ
jgi:hypothetical protein